MLLPTLSLIFGYTKTFGAVDLGSFTSAKLLHKISKKNNNDCG